MKQFACGDVVPGCQASFVGESVDDVLGQIAAHAREDHGILEVTSDLEERVRAHIH